MQATIALLPGDGIGPEVIQEAQKVLAVVAERFGHTFTYETGLVGATAIDATGNPFPEATHALCVKADAILFGAIGDPKYDNDPTAKVRPEQGLLAMRKALGLFANIRPVKAWDQLAEASPLRPEVIQGVDLVILRELISGIYFGQPRGRNEAGTQAFDTCVYDKETILRMAKEAFEMARNRRKKVTLVDKANVLATSRLWREVVTEYAATQTDIEFETMFVDNAAMQLIRDPKVFDVVLTGNLFGDILSDEASVITGSLGTLPSASVGEQTSLFEPVHGSYPQAAGQNRANPIATILSAAMMLEMAFGLHAEGQAIRAAVDVAIAEGKTTEDLANGSLSCTEVGDFIASQIRATIGV
ncbi:3-isopropylmalate dehydrogenase [Pontibacter sp. G13]|uniref:3-isopropylmalate dehydrogenase n=1 Tax=Pontibacter sp. G13 TaxID=3074898 RepID=UPI00288B9B59|nr:3-isopropylmalate dehydrogenase [Pontibacter sp. G13]WNJ19609.1 3-isopropylmalate dehydrogenase [Pontibacter sp. G13]